MLHRTGVAATFPETRAVCGLLGRSGRARVQELRDRGYDLGRCERLCEQDTVGTPFDAHSSECVPVM